MHFSRGDDAHVTRLRLGYAGAHGVSEPHLSVDGLTPEGPNLSHWPGNRTPGPWRADLSTGIALRFARADVAEQNDFLGEAETVVNDHYDTDGFGSLLAVLRPDVAFAREELLLAAAGVGDFGTWHTWRGFAIDRIVKNLDAPESPVRAVFRNAKDADDACLLRYGWLIEHAESVLDHPGSYRVLYEREMATVEQQLDRGLRGDVQLAAHREHDFAVLTTDGPRHRLVLNTLAGAFRVLHVERRGAERCYRYHDRTESWFDLVTIRPQPRRDLRPLAERLAALEPANGGASWCADPPDTPIPELYFGVPSEQAYGEITRELRPSALAPERVVEALLAHFTNGT